MNTRNSLPESFPDRQNNHAPRAPRGFSLLAGCGLAIVVSTALFAGSQHASGADAAPAAPTIAQVSMRNVQFSPATLEVKKGGVVEWKNGDLVPHTATSPAFDSGSLASGQSWRHTFTNAGTFPYACTFHPHMKGVVIVK